MCMLHLTRSHWTPSERLGRFNVGRTTKKEKENCTEETHEGDGGDGGDVLLSGQHPLSSRHSLETCQQGINNNACSGFTRDKGHKQQLQQREERHKEALCVAYIHHKNYVFQRSHKSTWNEPKASGKRNKPPEK